MLIESNVKDWLVCKPNSTVKTLFPSTKQINSTLSYSVSCKNVKDITRCDHPLPDTFLWTKDGPSLIVREKGLSRGTYYSWIDSPDMRWPAHNLCGRNSRRNHVVEPYGTIFLR